MRKVLVISFDAFSISNSNGRSLGSILNLIGCDLDISQIYIKETKPDFVKGKYCHVSEIKLFKTFMNYKKSISFFEINEPFEKHSKKSCNNKKNHKTPLKCLFRNLFWKIAFLFNRNIFKWIEEISPDYILLQYGDLPALCDFALKVSKKTQAKLIFYSTEDYGLKNHNYLNSGKKSILYNIFHKQLYKATKRVVALANHLIFLTNSLLEAFKNEFNFKGNGCVIYPFSTLSSMPIANNDNLVFSYCGNLGLKRYETIMVAAEIIQKHYKGSRFIVCGPCEQDINTILTEYPFIDYLGVVSYSEVIKIYNKSNFILHVESFDKFTSFDSKHAFSGKISDCIKTTKPFIFIGPSCMYEYTFLKENNAAFVFDSLNDFETFIINSDIKRIVNDTKNQEDIYEKYFSKNRTISLLLEVFDLK